MRFNIFGVRFFFSRLIFELKCVLSDISNYTKNKRKLNELSGQSYNLFVCSLPFLYGKKWQVVSQTELWERFSERDDVILCGSFLSYKIFGRRAKNVVSLEPKYNAPKIKFSKKHDKVIVFLSDAHSKSWLNKYIKKNNITDIITPYKKTLLDTGFSSELIQNKVHSFPWCVNDHIVSGDQVRARSNEVLGFGKTGSKVYDLREWSFDSGEVVSFNYAGSGNQKFSGDSFYFWLRNYDACVVGMSTIPLYNYTVAKFFEIPSQGLLLFAFPTVDIAELGFEDGVNCIFVTKENFKNKLEHFKNDPNLFISIREAGVKFIKEHHTVSVRLKMINNLLNN